MAFLQAFHLVLATRNSLAAGVSAASCFSCVLHNLRCCACQKRWFLGMWTFFDLDIGTQQVQFDISYSTPGATGKDYTSGINISKYWTLWVHLGANLSSAGWTSSNILNCTHRNDSTLPIHVLLFLPHFCSSYREEAYYQLGCWCSALFVH